MRPSERWLCEFCRRLHRSWRGRSAAVRKGLPGRMSRWPSVKANRHLAALTRIGWTIAWQNGSHRRLQRLGWPNYTFAFHDSEEIGPGPARTDCEKDRLASRGPVATLSCTGGQDPAWRHPVNLGSGSGKSLALLNQLQSDGATFLGRSRAPLTLFRKTCR